MIGTPVTLSEAEMRRAAQVGVDRQVSSLLKHLPDAHGYDGEDGWTVHIEGAMGELCVARVLDIEWSESVDTFQHGGDVGHLQVKTRSRHTYDLIVRPDARPSDFYVLVTGKAPYYIVRGWIRAQDATRKEWVHDFGCRPDAWFVPKEALLPIESLALVR